MPRDSRTYITVHDGLPDHPKIEILSDAAFRLLVTTWCWCSRQQTDGHVRAASWDRRGSAKSRAELVGAGLAEETADGVYMHDYTEHQRTADEVAALREKRAEAGRRGGEAKARGKQTASKPVANGVASATANGKQTPSKVVAETEKIKDFPTSPGGAASEETAQTIVGWWIDQCKDRPPGVVIGQISKQVKTMIDEGIGVDRIRGGVTAWQAKGMHPSTLPTFVHQVSTQSDSEPWKTDPEWAFR